MSWVKLTPENCPPIGTKCFVLSDNKLGDWYNQHTFNGEKWVPRQRFDVYAATLEVVDEDGTEWRHSARAFFGPGTTWFVTHIQPYPEPLPEDYDAVQTDDTSTT